MIGVDVNEAGDKIAALFSQPKQPSEEPVVDQETDLEPELSDEEDYTPEPPAVEGDDTESAEPTYKVKVNGEEREVSLDDMRKGYMMEADYRQKTSALSESRKALEARESQLSEKIDQAESLLQFELDSLDPEEKEYDPAAYYEKRDKIEAKRKKLEELKSEASKNATKKYQDRLIAEQKKLIEAMPSWVDHDTANKEAGLIQEVWDSYGLTPDDLGHLVDHRFALISREAALYRQLKNGKPEGTKVTPKPKVAKPGTTKTAEQKQSEASKKLRAKVKQTGNMRDAAAAIRELMR